MPHTINWEIYLQNGKKFTVPAAEKAGYAEGSIILFRADSDDRVAVLQHCVAVQSGRAGQPTMVLPSCKWMSQFSRSTRPRRPATSTTRSFCTATLRRKEWLWSKVVLC